jgi:hypothetical protein
MTVVSASRTTPVQVRGRYYRSVQLQRDWGDRVSLHDYLLTPTARELTTRIVGELRRPGGTRAWSITGPYGTGKSSFALFLTRFLEGELGEHVEARAFREELNPGKAMVPVLIVGRRMPIKIALLSALEEQLTVLAPEVATKAGRLASDHDVGDREVAELFELAANRVADSGFAGVLLILDEFGKFLEYTAANLDSEDLLVMQEIAESATRSANPLVVATILHSSFSAYLNVDSEAEQAEWQKVQGRYVDVAFQEPTEQLLRLVGEAIESDFDESLERRYQSRLETALGSAALAEAHRRLPLRSLLSECFPLEPVTALLLSPLFRSKLAQNERSLFSFLTGEEPYGFQHFLRGADWDNGTAPMYQLPQLYDYVNAALGVSAHRGNLARRWVEIDDALSRVKGDAPARTHDVVKAIGLLWMYGSAVGLRASTEVLQLGLGEPHRVAEALDYLQRQSIIVYRKFEDSFALWEGSDVDLNDRYSEASAHVGRGSLAHRLRKAVEPQPIVARAHYIESGTLRFFKVHIIDGDESELAEIFRSSLAGEDGQIVYVLMSDSGKRERLLEKSLQLSSSTEQSNDLRVIAFPKPLAGLEAALKELEVWRWVRSNTPALEGDQVASKELYALLRFAELRLESIAGKVLGLRGYRFEPGHSDWIQCGRRHAISDSKSLLKWLSRLCDSAFHLAPTFHNELINRSEPSPAANSALYKLVKAMVVNGDKEKLGISGSPPELSMYESLVRAGDFHRTDGKHWWFDEPAGPWQPAWQEIEAFLQTTRKKRRPIAELYDRLKLPPFGMRQGPMPVLLVAMLLVKRNSVALYQDGLFQPGLTEQLAEQLARNPDSFEVQEFAYDDETKQLLDTMTKVVNTLDDTIATSTDSPLLRIARPLILFAARLPKYTKNTKRLQPPEAEQLRDALLKARDPHQLLLVDVPKVLRVRPETRDGQRHLAGKLEAALVGLQRAYPDLLDSIEQQVKEAFDLVGQTSEDIQNALMTRAEPLRGLASDPTLMAFLYRATQKRESEDWREMIGLVVVQGRATKDWSDADVAAFQASLQVLASDFKRLEELALEKRKSAASKVVRIGVLGDKSQEAREVISVHPDDESHVHALADTLLAELAKYGERELAHSRRIRLAALSQVILQELERNDG